MNTTTPTSLPLTQEEYFGTKELYHIALKANCDMDFGIRSIAQGEPVLYFEHLDMTRLGESATVRMARGGWGNMPRVVWEDRSEMMFSFSEGVMNRIGMGLVLAAKVGTNEGQSATYIPTRELFDGTTFRLEHTPTEQRPIFCYEYDLDCIQKKVKFTIDKDNLVHIVDGDNTKGYVIDYYYQYGEEATHYLIEKQRFNGTFTLEGRFYTVDENTGKSRTNLLTLPKVRIVTGINLSLGESANPMVSAFNAVAMPVEDIEKGRTILASILQLPYDIDEIEV